MNKYCLLIVALFVSACGGTPAPFVCPGPADNTSAMHFFGDSITYGTGNKDSGGRQYGYVQMLSRTLGVNVDDKAVAGSGIQDCGQLPSVLASTIQPDQTYVLMAGTNDIHYKMGEDFLRFKAQYAQAVAYLVASPSKQVVLAGPYYEATDATPELRAVVDEYANAMSEIATSNGLVFIDLRNVITPAELVSDGIHPNAQGHEAIENAFLAVLH